MFESCQRLVEGSMNLLLERKSLRSERPPHLHDGCANVLLMNFGNGAQHVLKGTAICVPA